jgi:predicted acetyltransferase
MDDVEVVRLTNKNSKYFKTICKWIYNWWGEIEGWSYEKVHELMENSLSENKISKTFIALKNKEIIGMYQIVMSDLDTRPDIYPWLTNIYVDEKYRGNGVCKLLLEHAIEEAKKMKIKELYLYTAHIGLYEKYGWKYVGNVNTYRKVNSVERLYVYKIMGKKKGKEENNNNTLHQLEKHNKNKKNNPCIYRI